MNIFDIYFHIYCLFHHYWFSSSHYKTNSPPCCFLSPSRKFPIRREGTTEGPPGEKSFLWLERILVLRIFIVVLKGTVSKKNSEFWEFFSFLILEYNIGFFFNENEQQFYIFELSKMQFSWQCYIRMTELQYAVTMQVFN